MSGVVFLDTETTGLDPRTERMFEIATIFNGERVFRIQPPSDVVAKMHPKAVEVNRYHERTSAPDWVWHDEYEALGLLGRILNGNHIVGAVPSFDANFITAAYQRAELPVPRFHYHLIDVENLAVGFLAAKERTFDLPWDSEALSKALGINPPRGDDRHTALADARWAKAIYEYVMEAKR